MIQPLPAKELQQMLKKFKNIVVVEEHFQSGGLYSRLMHNPALSGLRDKISSVAIPDAYLHQILKLDGFRKHLKLDGMSLKKYAQALIQ